MLSVAIILATDGEAKQNFPHAASVAGLHFGTFWANEWLLCLEIFQILEEFIANHSMDEGSGLTNVFTLCI